MKLVASPNNQKDFTRNQPDTSPTRSSGRRVILAGQPEPPPSEVSEWTGLTGLAGFALAFFLIFTYQKELPVAYKSLEILGVTALPMIVFKLIRLKAYKTIVTNIRNYSAQKPDPEPAPNILIRMLGVLITIAPFTIVFFVLKAFAEDRYYGINYAIALLALLMGLPIILLGSAIYFFIAAEKDAYWHLGLMALRKQPLTHTPELWEHWRQWLLKVVFIPFSWAIVYGTMYVLESVLENFSYDLFQMFFLLQAITLVIGAVFGTIGYVFSLRIINSHIRSTQSSVLGWVVCLICYPPLLFVLFSFANIDDTITWDVWLKNAGLFAWLWGITVLFFQCLYVWSTVIFGMRFSNLTNRGIITNGPYRYFKHPGYLGKVISFWLISMPFIPAVALASAIVNSAQLLFVSLIYYLRGKTEERHLLKDERYRAYTRWIEQYGVLAKLRHAFEKNTVGRLVLSLNDRLSKRLLYIYERHIPRKQVLRRLW